MEIDATQTHRIITNWLLFTSRYIVACCLWWWWRWSKSNKLMETNLYYCSLLPPMILDLYHPSWLHLNLQIILDYFLSMCAFFGHSLLILLWASSLRRFVRQKSVYSCEHKKRKERIHACVCCLCRKQPTQRTQMAAKNNIRQLPTCKTVHKRVHGERNNRSPGDSHLFEVAFELRGQTPTVELLLSNSYCRTPTVELLELGQR